MIQSFVIASKNTILREEQEHKILSSYRIDKFDLTIIEPQESIGITEIRSIQKQIFLKPMGNGAKAVIIRRAEQLTIEAQNALLKTLEEPPENTIIVLSASKKEALLPTILSRCKIIEYYNQPISIEDKQKTLQEYKKIIKSGIGEKLVTAQELAKNKENALLWIERLINGLRDELIQDVSNATYHNLIRKLQKTYFVLSTTNTNPRLTLENMLLSL